MPHGGLRASLIPEQAGLLPREDLNLRQRNLLEWVPSALVHARATSSRIGSPRTRHSLPHLRPTYSASTASASLLSVRLCFFVNILNAIGRKCDNSIWTGRKVAGDCCRGWRVRTDDGTGMKGSELGGGSISALFCGRLNIGATVDILESSLRCGCLPLSRNLANYQRRVNSVWIRMYRNYL